MATVRFSKELRDTILGNARIMMNCGVERIEGSRPDPKIWGEKIYNTLFAELKPVFKQLPDGWLSTVSTIKVAKVGKQRCNMEFHLPSFGQSSGSPWPVQFIETSLAKRAGSYNQFEIELKESELWRDLEVEIEDYNTKLQAARNRKDEFVAMVDKVIESYATLAPALKTWPPLWDLLPESVKDKHRHVEVRGPKEKVELDVDMDKLTALSTAAKFGV